MKKVKIKFVDFDKNFNAEHNDFVDMLRKHYIVELSDEPEYLFYSCFGYEHTKYSCIKIFYTAECVTPDFNICDYAIGFDELSFGDRYIRMPLYTLFQYRKDFVRAKQKHLDADAILAEERQFCSFVVSNDAGQPARKEVFDLLSAYKRVDSGGRYLNNIGYRVPDKQEFLSHYKFNLAFENCIYCGYTTEKITQAFAAGCIPIYYGDPDVVTEFNPKSFINGHDYSSWEEMLEEVKRVDSDPALYEEMLRTPIMLKEPQISELEAFLTHIVDQEYTEAKRRPTNTHIGELEAWRRRVATAHKLFRPFKRVGNLIRRIRNKSL